MRYLLAVLLGLAVAAVDADAKDSVGVGEKTVRVTWTADRTATYVAYVAARGGCAERVVPKTIRVAKGRRVTVLLRARPRLCLGWAYVGVDRGRRNVLTEHIDVRRRR